MRLDWREILPRNAADNAALLYRKARRTTKLYGKIPGKIAQGLIGGAIYKWEGEMYMETQNMIAKALLSVGAVIFRPNEPFIWASGIKSPVYCDNRLILTSPDIRLVVEETIARIVREQYPQTDILMGTATAGIAHAAIAAHILHIPMGYVRSSAKDHGRGKQIEGAFAAGDRAVVIEDLISTGGSVIETVRVLREAGIDVLGVVSIFTYNMEKAATLFEAENVKKISLTDFDVTVAQALVLGYINEQDAGKLLTFRDNPSDESWIGGTAE